MATAIQWQNSSGVYFTNATPIVAGTNYKLYSYVDLAGYYTISIRVKDSNGIVLGTHLVQSEVNKGANSYWTIDVTPLLQYAEFVAGGKIDAILIKTSGSSVTTGDYLYTVPIPSTPSFTTYPSVNITDTTGITLSWSASTVSYGIISGYILERKINNGSWTQIYIGTSRIFNDTADKVVWDTVVYRIKSYTSGISSVYATGSTITITHASMIVKNNGVWAKGIPFVRNNGVWTKGIGVFVKINGVWTRNK
jgi:hypothetical protein